MKRAKTTYCDWTSYEPVCGQLASTTRRRTHTGETWLLCDFHASEVDRIRA